MATEAQWIDCSERMPDSGQEVLFVAGGFTDAGIYDAGSQDWQAAWRSWQSDSYGDPHVYSLGEVDIWMPLPAPSTAARKGE